MDITQFISSRLAAEILGVSVSTVKRWVDDNILPASKTPGGHRKIMVSDVIRLSRQGILPVGDFSKLPWNPDQDENNLNITTSSDAFYHALRNQSVLTCNNILLSAYKSKMSIEKIADDIIQPSMARIGDEWHNGKLSIFFEHCSTQLCLSSLIELRSVILSDSNRTRPLAIGGCISNDNYQLSNILVDLVLLDHGWQTVNIGINTPTVSFLEALEHLKPRLMWLTVSEILNVDEFISDNALIFAKVCDIGCVLVIGGRALIPAIRKKIKFHFYGDTMCHMGDYIAGLYPSVELPKRGRPPS